MGPQPATPIAHLLRHSPQMTTIKMCSLSVCKVVCPFLPQHLIRCKKCFSSIAHVLAKTPNPHQCISRHA